MQDTKTSKAKTPGRKPQRSGAGRLNPQWVKQHCTQHELQIRAVTELIQRQLDVALGRTKAKAESKETIQAQDSRILWNSTDLANLATAQHRLVLTYQAVYGKDPIT